MSPIKLYGINYSTCTQRVLIVLHELGLDFELVPVDLIQGQHKDANYQAQYQPFGRVPALDDNGFCMFESKAICRYLVAKYGHEKAHLLPPQSPEVLARFEQAASVEEFYFDSKFTKLAYEKLFKKMMGHGEPDAKVVETL